jgi:hypothetical protein
VEKDIEIQIPEDKKENAEKRKRKKNETQEEKQEDESDGQMMEEIEERGVQDF